MALVTGAGRGIGRAVALAFAREGATVVLAARTAAELDAVAREIEGAGGRALVLPADVRQEAAVAALVRRLLDAYGRIDLLVAAAGTAAFGLLVETDPPAWDEMMAAVDQGDSAQDRRMHVQGSPFLGAHGQRRQVSERGRPRGEGHPGLVDPAGRERDHGRLMG